MPNPLSVLESLEEEFDGLETEHERFGHTFRALGEWVQFVEPGLSALDEE